MFSRRPGRAGGLVLELVNFTVKTTWFGGAVHRIITIFHCSGRCPVSGELRTRPGVDWSDYLGDRGLANARDFSHRFDSERRLQRRESRFSRSGGEAQYADPKT
jgi:hypothetical protein